MRVVLDTNVLLSATLWSGSVAQKLLFKLFESNASIFSSLEIISEYTRVLKRDFNYSDTEASYVASRVLAFVTLVKPVVKLSVVKEDADDNKIIECALASNSLFLITYDKALLKIKNYQNISVLTPEQFLALT